MLSVQEAYKILTNNEIILWNVFWVLQGIVFVAQTLLRKAILSRSFN